MRRIAILTALLLAGCNLPPQGGSTTITPGPSPPIQLPPDAALDLTTAASNFDNAATGGLPDMALFAACQHMLNQDFGVEVVPGPGGVTPPPFKVTNNGVVSGISIIIIDADKAKNAVATGLQIPQSCAEVFGLIGMQGWASVLGLGPLHITIQPDPAPIAALRRNVPVMQIGAPVSAKAKK